MKIDNLKVGDSFTEIVTGDFSEVTPEFICIHSFIKHILWDKNFSTCLAISVNKNS